MERARNWLYKHPFITLLIVILAFVLKDLPEWLASIWALRSSKPLFATLEEKMQTFQFPHISAYWIARIFGWGILVAIFYLLIRGRRVSSPASDKDSESPVDKKGVEVGDSLATCPDKWLHALADGEVNRVWEFIEVFRVGVWRLNFEAAIPTIKWGLVVKNNSLFPITLDGEVRGHLLFNGTRLLEQRTLIRNDIDELSHLTEGQLIFEQRLSKLEVDMINDNPEGKFSFQGLQIHFKGGKGFDQIRSRELLVPDEFKVGLHKIFDKTSQAVSEAIAPIQAEKEDLMATLESEREKASVPPGNLRIIGALYGIPGTREEDVTGKLSMMIVNHELIVDGFYNDILGIDPVPTKKKQLTINYQHNGMDFSVTAPENAKLRLPIAYGDPKRLRR